MHRNTLLLTVTLAVIATLLISVNSIRNFSRANTDSQTNRPTGISMIRYESAQCGITLQYPSNLKIQESTMSATAFLDQKNPSQSVVLACQKDIPRAPLPSSAIEQFFIPTSTLASLSAQLYHNTNAQNGAKLDELIFFHPKKKIDIYLAGFGATFQQMIVSLKLL